MTTSTLTTTEYGSFYAGYIALVPSTATLPEALAISAEKLLEPFSALPEARGEYAYAPGKWTVRESLQHIIDTERIFGYRALTIARGDQIDLPGYDQDYYVAAHQPLDRPLAEMAREMYHLRQANLAMFRAFTPQESGRMGRMSDTDVSVRALGFIMSGHVLHHAGLYRDKYGLA